MKLIWVIRTLNVTIGSLDSTRNSMVRFYPVEDRSGVNGSLTEYETKDEAQIAVDDLNDIQKILDR